MASMNPMFYVSFLLGVVDLVVVGFVLAPKLLDEQGSGPTQHVRFEEKDSSKKLVESDKRIHGVASAELSGKAKENTRVGETVNVLQAKDTPSKTTNRREASGDLPGIYFRLGSYTLGRRAQATVEGAAKLMKSAPRRKLLLRGHSDYQGSVAYNKALSYKRAAEVGRLLNKLGISSRRFEIEAVGNGEPVVRGTDPKAWAKNRRVELSWHKEEQK